MHWPLGNWTRRWTTWKVHWNILGLVTFFFFFFFLVFWVVRVAWVAGNVGELTFVAIRIDVTVFAAHHAIGSACLLLKASVSSLITEGERSVIVYFAVIADRLHWWLFVGWLLRSGCCSGFCRWANVVGTRTWCSRGWSTVRTIVIVVGNQHQATIVLILVSARCRVVLNGWLRGIVFAGYLGIDFTFFLRLSLDWSRSDSDTSRLAIDTNGYRYAYQQCQ